MSNFLVCPECGYKNRRQRLHISTIFVFCRNCNLKIPVIYSIMKVKHRGKNVPLEWTIDWSKIEMMRKASSVVRGTCLECGGRMHSSKKRKICYKCGPAIH